MRDQRLTEASGRQSGAPAATCRAKGWSAYGAPAGLPIILGFRVTCVTCLAGLAEAQVRLPEPLGVGGERAARKGELAMGRRRSSKWTCTCTSRPELGG